MSRRGGGGGRHNDSRDQPFPSLPTAGGRGAWRGGGRAGGDGGRTGGRTVGGSGRGQRSPYAGGAPPSQSHFQPPPSSPSVAAPPPAATSVSVPATYGGSTSGSSTLSGDMQKLTLAESTPNALPPASSKGSRFPARPGYGKLGMKCLVRANHFLVDVADKDLNHYDVSISPDCPSKKVNRDIIKQLVSQYRKSHLGEMMPAYDGRKSLYTPGELPFKSKDFKIKLVENGGESAGSSSTSRRDREFTVSIKWVAKLDIYHLKQFLARKQMDAPHEIIQLLDVVLRASPSENYTVVGRSFFHSSLGPKGELGNGMEYWRGYYQSLRPTQMGLSLNIDVSARAFYEPICVTDFISKYLSVRDLSRPLSDQDRVKVKKALKSIRVKLSHGKYVKTHKISGVSDQPAGQLMFTLDDQNTQISVAQYFREKYGITLKYKSLPALQAGSQSKPVYLPMELCTIAQGQRYARKLNETQVTNMLRATCQRPRDRESSVARMVDGINFGADELVKDQFGIRVKNDLTVVEARVLEPPQVKYHRSGRESTVNPRFGSWNMINKVLYEGAKIDSWTCVNFSTRVREEEVCHHLVSMCVDKGMKFASHPIVPVRSAQPRNIEKTLHEIHTESSAELERRGSKDKQIQLLIVILPDVSGSYGKIKKICETQLGIVSQCCHPKNVGKLNKQYFENVAMKINVKTGGRNCILEKRIPMLTDRPTIIFGADVTHPQPGEDTSPSIAAVVASMDWPEVTKYMGLVSSQHHREEIIQDLYKKTVDPQKGIVHGGMIRELLLSFYKATKQKPHQIIFYRDGVSEGQFSQVLQYEMTAIREACQSLQPGYLPPVTFVVVQKRHHTRFFPANHNEKNLMDKSGNILPGTVVDTHICHPTEFDFYLNSHAGIQGTSRPAHYHVLYDENKFTADHMQNLTNSLCYTYARCTKSVSVVPPAYYAHLAAFRARYYIEGEFSDAGSSCNNSTLEKTAPVVNVPPVMESVRKHMFYC
ncbi:protein argonaute 5-like [Rutidosis leptorrhynchoides]|uniref:protein argonaute 5-like n=1 Tax=Rutidosis leptorrhynchoides TaxID=125765 RepID=UPI003A992446